MGWTVNFGITLSNGKKMCLDLKQDEDLFLLFVLASSWSKTGPWENGAYFTTYLKESKKAKAELWLDNDFVKKEIDESKKNSLNIVNVCSGIVSRRAVSFRKDYYSSIVLLAKNWNEIKEKLRLSIDKNNYDVFVNYMSLFKGLGAGQNKMRIKIPLILRELRCQKYCNNIPGELCCVPDARVIKAAKEIGIRLPYVNSTSSLLKASKIIYEAFGDLYDIPLFAYVDI